MNYQKKPVERLFQDVKDYIIAQRNLVLITLSKKGADALYVIITASLFLFLGWFFLIFLSFAIAYAIGNLIGITWLGFLIVAFLYFLVGVIVWAKKDRWIKTPLLNLFLKMSISDNDQDDE